MAPVGELALPAARHLPRAGHSPHDGHPSDTDPGDRRRAHVIPAPARPVPTSTTWPAGCPRYFGGIAIQVLDRNLEEIPMITAGMSTSSTARKAVLSDPGYQAFLLLRMVFTVAPIVFGLDKFANLLVDWPSYLAPWIDGIVPGTAQQAMYAVGVIEIVAGIAVALAPRFGAWLVVAWLAGIIVNLLTFPGYFDIALRDFGLLVGAVALARLATRYTPGRRTS